MDGNQFDTWARQLASQTSRRTVLKTFVAGLVGGIAASAGIIRSEAAVTCPDGRLPCAQPKGSAICCNECSTCDGHGGGCSGSRCQKPATCVSGQCSCPANQQKCGPGCCDPAKSMTCVNGACQCADGRPPCLNSKGDPFCCSGCERCSVNGRGCEPGNCVHPQKCSGSACVCPEGRTICGSSCCDPAKGMTCVNGKCICADGRPSCIDPKGEPICCDGCSTCSGDYRGCRKDNCAAPQTCSGGTCVCPGGKTKCGRACIDPAPGISCLNDKVVCADGREACTGPKGESICCSGCKACGGPGRGCEADACLKPQTCSGGACVCPTGRAICGSTCCDPAKGQTCVDGSCVCADGRKACQDGKGEPVCCTGCSTCGKQGQVCMPNACKAPQICAGGQCVCKGGLTTCGTDCCNQALGQTCLNGTCTCPDGRPACKDRNGASVCCDECSTCAESGGSSACRSGACVAPSTCQSGSCVCPSGFTDCGTTCCSAAKCETCLNGSCKSTCSACETCDGHGNCVSACGAGFTCQNGTCVCADGRPTCNGQCCDGCESCVAGMCQSGCPAERICTAEGCVCDGNLTACGTDHCCDAGACEVCHRGVCTACGPCETCVNGACVSQCSQCQVCSSGTCVSASNGISCDAGDPCTDGDQCVAGSCVAGNTITCPDDGDPCTQNVCRAGEGGCIAVPIDNCCSSDSQCDDGNPCSTGICNNSSHTCQYISIDGCCQTDEACSDGDLCTTNTCDLDTNTCVSTPIVCNECQTCVAGDCVLVENDTGCGEGMTCQSGLCGSACANFVLSGGTSPTDGIPVDDDLEVYLNGTLIFKNDDGIATNVGPISFTATAGDEIRVVAIDVDTYCRRIDPVYLHCTERQTYELLSSGLDDGCGGDWTPGIFFDQAFTITMT